MQDIFKTVRVVVTGQVQGVWFRAWTQQTAQRLGVRGWVRNEPDGSVAALLAGPEGTVDRMVEALHRGPPAASVDTVSVTPEDTLTIPASFEIAG